MNDSYQMISDDDKDDIIEEGILPVDKIWKSTEYIHDTIPDDSDMNLEENGPVINPF